MREGTLFPSERVHMFFQLRIIFPLWNVYSVESVREGTLLYSLVRECTITCSFSWEAFFPREGLQCGVYEGRNSNPWRESVHVLSVEKHFSLWKVYNLESMREGTLFPGERGIHVLSVEKHFSFWKVYILESMREGTLFPGERVYNVHVILRRTGCRQYFFSSLNCTFRSAVWLLYCQLPRESYFRKYSAQRFIPHQEIEQAL